MAGQLGKFTMQHFDAWAPNITKKTHISSIFGSKTQKVNGLMVELMAAKYGKSIDTMLNKLSFIVWAQANDANAKNAKIKLLRNMLLFVY